MTRWYWNVAASEAAIKIGRSGTMLFTGVKVFSATKAREREQLSDRINEWIQANKNLDIVDKTVTQSSDNEFHCLTFTLFYKHT